MKDQLISLAKGTFAAGLGAALTYLTEHQSDIDFGDFKLVVAAVVGLAVNAARKWLMTWMSPPVPVPSEPSK